MSVSCFSVVQYFPDAARHERVNIGVVAYSAEKHEKVCQFVNNWRRVKYLGGDERFLKGVANDVEKMTIGDLQRAIANWKHVVQFTTPSASILDSGTLLIDSVKRYLVDPEVTEPQRITRSDLIQQIRSSLKHALTTKINRAAGKLIRIQQELSGKFESHSFDVSASNGTPIFAANAISFQASEKSALRRLIDSAKWAIEDIRQFDQQVRLTIVLAPPSPLPTTARPNLEFALPQLPVPQRLPSSPTSTSLTFGSYVPTKYASPPSNYFDQSCEIFKRLGANTIMVNDLQQWSAEMAELVRDRMPEYVR